MVIYQNERGISAVFVSIMLVVLLGFTGLSVDVGHLILTKIRLQQSADTAALSAIRGLDKYQSIASAIVQNSGFNLGNLTYNVMRGNWDAGFTQDEAGGSAVLVELGKSVPLYFINVVPGIPDKVDVEVRAVAKLRKAGAVVKLGATAIDINTNEGTLLKGLLGDMLGTSLNLSAAGWNGLLTAKLNLIDFINLAKLELGVGTADGVLESTMTLGGIVDVMINALQADASTLDVTAVIQGLTDLKLAVDPLNIKLPLGELLQLGTNSGSLVRADANVLSMVIAAAELFNHKSAVSIDNTTISLPGLVAGSPLVNADLKVLVSESPVIKVVTMDDPDVHSAGARVYVNLNVLGSTLHVPLYLELGSGTATLSAISEESVDLSVTTSLTDVYLGDIDSSYFYNTDYALDESDFAPVTILDLQLLLAQLTLDVKAYASAQGGAGELEFTPEEFGIAKSVSGGVGGSTGGLLGSLGSNLYVQAGGGGLLGPVLAPLLNLALSLLGLTNDGSVETKQDLASVLLSTLLEPLLTNLLNPVSALTGVHAGKTDVTVFDYAYEAVLVE